MRIKSLNNLVKQRQCIVAISDFSAFEDHKLLKPKVHRSIREKENNFSKISFDQLQNREKMQKLIDEKGGFANLKNIT